MASRSKQSRERENDEAESDQLITAKRLRELLGGVSEMHIWRLLSLEAYRPLQFPRPTKINGRNYWPLRVATRDRRGRQGTIAPTKRDLAEKPLSSSACLFASVIPLSAPRWLRVRALLLHASLLHASPSCGGAERAARHSVAGTPRRGRRCSAA